ncbi:MAG: hypothetical protein U0470_03575 [Anaerolineae bacterium]
MSRTIRQPVQATTTAMPSASTGSTHASPAFTAPRPRTIDSDTHASDRVWPASATSSSLPRSRPRRAS